MVHSRDMLSVSNNLLHFFPFPLAPKKLRCYLLQSLLKLPYSEFILKLSRIHTRHSGSSMWQFGLTAAVVGSFEGNFLALRNWLHDVTQQSNQTCKSLSSHGSSVHLQTKWNSAACFRGSRDLFHVNRCGLQLSSNMYFNVVLAFLKITSNFKHPTSLIYAE